MKIRILTAFLLFALTSLAQTKVPLQGKWWNGGGMVACIYDFDSTGNVTYKWSGCLGSYERLGYYRVSNDSVIVRYRPFTEVTCMPGAITDSINLMLTFRDKDIDSGAVVIFRRGAKEVLYTDLQGKTVIHQPSLVDSINVGGIIYGTFFHKRAYTINRPSLASSEVHVNITSLLYSGNADNNLPDPASEIMLLKSNGSLDRGEKFDAGGTNWRYFKKYVK